VRRALAVLLALQFAFPPLTVAPALAQLAEEKRLGEEFRDQAIAHIPLIHDYELAGFVREMGERLVKTLGPQPFEYEFFVVRDDDINAFAVPGGKLFANAGLVSRVENEDALAGVLGHEVAHSAGHHIVRQQQKGAAASYASLLGLLLGILNPALAIGAMAAGQAAQLSYQRDFEREANFMGIEYSRKAGYDPGAMMSLLRQLNQEFSMNPTRMPPYLLSHPMTSERLTNLEAVLGRREWDPSRVKLSFRMKRAQAIARAYSQGRDQCVPEYERAVAQAKPEQKAEALELLGILMSHGEEYGTAEKVLRQAEAAGRNVDRELGRTVYRRGNFPEARERLGRVIAKTPDDWDTLADLASMDFEDGRYEAAAEKLAKSIALEPYRGGVLRMNGRALAKLKREGEGFYWYGRASQVEGDATQAVAYYKKSIAALPKGDAAATALKDEMVRRSEKLGDAIKEERIEAQRESQRTRTTPNGTRVPMSPAVPR
jgi:predicted Zn-dependent protease